MTKSRQSPLVSMIVPLIVALIGLAGVIITALVREDAGQVKGRETAIAALQPTISALQTSAAQHPATGTFGTPVTQLLTVTQIVEVTPTVDKNTLLIESLTSSVVPYGGDDDPRDASRGSSRLTVNCLTGGCPQYVVNYSLPNAEQGYAGLAFKFSEPQDFTGYKFVEVTITFTDEQASCELFMKDISDRTDAVRLSNAIVSAIGQNHTARINLTDNYDAINRKVIKELGCNVTTDFSRGQHGFTISKVRWVNN